MDKRVKYALYGTAGVAGIVGTYAGYRSLKASNPQSPILSPVQSLVTAVSGGPTRAWARANGAVPTTLRDKGQPTYWPDGTGAASTMETQDIRGFITLCQRVNTGINEKLAICYACLAWNEAGSWARSCYHFNAYGIHWYRTMEPRPAFAGTDAGRAAMFLAFDNWTQSVQYLHGTLMQRSIAYERAKQAGVSGDLAGFTRELGAGGYSSAYARNPNALIPILAGFESRGLVQRGVMR